MTYRRTRTLICAASLLWASSCTDPAERPTPSDAHVPESISWELVDESLAGVSSEVPPAGHVPDKATAVAIAEAIASAAYGEATVASQRPFRARLKNGVWTVIGYLPSGFEGGTAVVRMGRDDGRILLVVHQE